MSTSQESEDDDTVEYRTIVGKHCRFTIPKDEREELDIQQDDVIEVEITKIA